VERVATLKIARGGEVFVIAALILDAVMYGVICVL